MPEEFRRWIHRHVNVVLPFVIGITVRTPERSRQDTDA